MKWFKPSQFWSIFQKRSFPFCVGTSQAAADFSLLQKVPTGTGDHPDSNSVGTGLVSPRVKRLGSEIDHSPPSNAEVDNEGICASIPPKCIYGMLCIM